MLAMWCSRSPQTSCSRGWVPSCGCPASPQPGASWPCVAHSSRVGRAASAGCCGGAAAALLAVARSWPADVSTQRRHTAAAWPTQPDSVALWPMQAAAPLPSTHARARAPPQGLPASTRCAWRWVSPRPAPSPPCGRCVGRCAVAGAAPGPRQHAVVRVACMWRQPQHPPPQHLRAHTQPHTHSSTRPSTSHWPTQSLRPALPSARSSQHPWRPRCCSCPAWAAWRVSACGAAAHVV